MARRSAPGAVAVISVDGTVSSFPDRACGGHPFGIPHYRHSLDSGYSRRAYRGHPRDRRQQFPADRRDRKRVECPYARSGQYSRKPGESRGGGCGLEELRDLRKTRARAERRPPRRQRDVAAGDCGTAERGKEAEGGAKPAGHSYDKRARSYLLQRCRSPFHPN